jgi:hypothetical protein
MSFDVAAAVRRAMALAKAVGSAWARDEMMENPRTFQAPAAEKALQEFLEQAFTEAATDPPLSEPAWRTSGGIPRFKPRADAVDWLGLALELEAQAKRVESQTAERAMLAAAHGLRLMGTSGVQPSGADRDRRLIRITWELAGASGWIDEATIAKIIADADGEAPHD